MAKKGHSFPAAAGFTGSTGQTRSVRGYTQAVPAVRRSTEGPPSKYDAQVNASLNRSPLRKAAGGVINPQNRPVITSSPKTPPRMLPPSPPRLLRPVIPLPRAPGRQSAYAKGGYVTETIGDQGNAAVKRGNPPIVESDKQYGGKSPLNVGYKQGGRAFNRSPKFGK